MERQKVNWVCRDSPATIQQYFGVGCWGNASKRKWLRVRSNSSSSMLFATATLVLLLMISTSPLCAGARESRITITTGAGGGKGVISSANNFGSNALNRAAYNNATTTHRDGENTGGGGGGGGYTWVIERRECAQLDNGCFCEKSRNWTVVKCRCDSESQVAHLKPPSRDSRPSSLFRTERWTWKFEECSSLVLHSHFLRAVDGSQFQVEFHKISNLTVEEEAFETKVSYNQGNPNQVSILFNQCKIERLPTKSFPSYVHSIRVRGCDIKTLERRFIYALEVGAVSIEGSRIDDIQSGAFYNATILDTLNVENSTVLSVHSDGVASALNKMEWKNSEVDVLQEHALSGNMATVTLENCKFANVESSGFSIKQWSNVILFNNTFTFVGRRGIDLSHFSSSGAHSDDGDDDESYVPLVEISNNNWEKVERDFISTGSSDTPYIRVESNIFLTQCDCGNTFASYLTMNGSKLWFHQEILNNSKCPVSEQVLNCLVANGHLNSSESSLLPYDSLNLLCDTKVYMCMNDVSDVGVTTDETIPGGPQLPNRLRVLAYFIAAMGIFIIASLIITICVFLCRKKTPRKKSPSDSPLQDLENAQGKKTVMSKSLSGGEYADIVFKHQNASAARPRSMLLEDVEMEDKGVQTMPTELSSEVLEGLREKLSRPDSFWDAKETIDHLYDLIQVKELNSSALSSPPDVTMCNGQSTTASTARLLPSTSSSPVAQITSAGVSVSIGGSDPHILQSCNAASNTSSPMSDTPPPLPATSPPSGVPLIQRYAQIRNKAKTAPLCEYSDPSDSSMHIYSELTPQHPDEASAVQVIPSNGKIPSPSRAVPSRELSPLKKSFLSSMKNGGGGGAHNGPILCEYTEPKDVQAHVYAELSNNPSQQQQQQSKQLQKSKSVTSSPVKGMGSPSKHPISLSHLNTITIAVPPPPVNIPHSSSFSSPRLLGRIKENEISSSNPSLASKVATPVKIIHVNDLEACSDSRPSRLSSSVEKLKRSVSSVDATTSPKMLSSLLSGSGSGLHGLDTQKRPLPSIPSSWCSKNEGKSQL